MRILLVGSGGVGDALARILARRFASRPFADAVVVADHDAGRAERTVAAVRAREGAAASAGFSAARVDASDAASVTALAREVGATHVMNAVDPRFVMPVFTGALQAGADYLDMAMSLSRPHPERPHELTGVKLGDEQFALEQRWRDAGHLALVGIGVEPGLADVLARYACEELFSHVTELGVRDGANLVVAGHDFAPSFSIWTTIEECLNPPVVWADGAWSTLAPFSEPEVFDFPGGIGPVECVHVEHEEVLLMPRWLQADRVTFKYGLGEEFIAVLRTLHKLGLDSAEPLTVKGVQVSPRDVVAAALPDPATLGPLMSGSTCAGVLVTGTGRGEGFEGQPREVYLHHVVDNAWSMAEYGAQCVVWQTAVNPAVALELLATGAWAGTGVLGPEALPHRPFLDLLAADDGYASPWALQERTPGGGAAPDGTGNVIGA